jgi:glyoxylate reductase
VSRPSVLVTRRLPSNVLARLEGVSDVDVSSEPDSLTHEALIARVQDKTALISLITDKVDRAVLDAGESLRVIANVAVGYNNIDVDYAASRGIVVTNTPDVLSNAVADFTWALILGITRRIGEGERLVRRGAWKGWTFDFMLGSELRGRQLGIVGMGRIGRAVAEKAPVFGMSVAYASKSRAADIPDAVSMSLDQLLASSDVVSLHVPLTSATHHLIDQRALMRMKRSAYLVNTTRGQVIDEAALAWALGERLIAGAALDVYEHEPELHPALLGLENVLLAPHLGSATKETRTAMADLAVSNVMAVLSGQPPLTPVTSRPGS